MITAVRITETDVGSATHVHDVIMNIRPDNRNQLLGDVVFDDSTTTETTLSVTGHIDYDSGNTTVNGIITGGAVGSTFVFDYATFTLRFTPVSTMNGRTTVQIKTELTDLTIDPNEDFLIDLTQETMQDYNNSPLWQ